MQHYCEFWYYVYTKDVTSVGSQRWLIPEQPKEAAVPMNHHVNL